VQTVVETPEFLAAASRSGMTDEERIAAVDYIAANPRVGDIVEGTGGARKVRIPKAGKGKSGGYRVMTYYMNADRPVFLVTVISKGQRANLTDQQKKAVKDSAKSENRRRRRK